MTGWLRSGAGESCERQYSSESVFPLGSAVYSRNYLYICDMKDKKYYLFAKVYAVVMLVIAVTFCIGCVVAGQISYALGFFAFAIMSAIYWCDIDISERVSEFAQDTDRGFRGMMNIAQAAIDLNSKISQDAQEVLDRNTRMAEVILDMLREMTQELRPGTPAETF